MNMQIKRYNPDYKKTWDEFVKTNTNFFFFQRDFLEYHKDKFVDHSLIFLDDNELIAVLPATESGKSLVSHGGLTYGFFICNEQRYSSFKNIWSALQKYCKQNNILDLVYKKPPFFFSQKMNDNDVYELQRINGAVAKVDLSSYIDFSDYNYSKGRKSSVKKGYAQGLSFESDSSKFEGFYDLLTEVLFERYKINPVHTLSDLKFLKSKFPENLTLDLVIKDKKIQAGSLLFIFGSVVHTQYLCVAESGKVLCAMDYLLDNIIKKYKSHMRGLSFGISTEKNGKSVNEGLLLQKESYGAKNYLVSTYRIFWDQVHD